MNGTFRVIRQANKVGGPSMRARRTFGAILIAGVAALLLQQSVIGHPAFDAEFDRNKPIKFQDAVVTKVELINPHSWIRVDIKTPDGKVENWAIEAGSPNILLRRGITKDTLKIGTKKSG